MAEQLGECLSQTTTLVRLVLRNNPLGAEGVRSIARGLSSCADWQISTRRAAALRAIEEAKAATKSRAHRRRASADPLGTHAPAGSAADEALRAAGSARPGSLPAPGCPLVELDLSGTSMTAPQTAGVAWLLAHGLREVCDFLMRPDCGLQVLRLGKNHISEDLCDPLLTALQHNSTLRCLELADCRLGAGITARVLRLTAPAVPRRLLALPDEALPPRAVFTPGHRLASRAAAAGAVAEPLGLPPLDRLPPLLKDGRATTAGSAATSARRAGTAASEGPGAGPPGPPRDVRAGADAPAGQGRRPAGRAGDPAERSRDAGGAPQRLTTRNAASFPWLLRQGPCLMESLSLRGCDVGDEGADELRSAMQRRCRLRHLDVSRNGISARGFRLLALGMRTTFLQSVDVSHNDIGAVGAHMLAGAIGGRLTTVRSVRASFCNLAQGGTDPSGAIAVADSLRSNRVLMHLDLSGNSLVLQRAGYHPTPLTNTVVYRLAAALRDNRTLLTLNLARNWVGLPGQRALREAIAAQGGAVPDGGVVADTLQRWLKRMLWRRAEARLGPGAGSGHPAVAPIYRGVEGGRRFDPITGGSADPAAAASLEDDPGRRGGGYPALMDVGRATLGGRHGGALPAPGSAAARAEAQSHEGGSSLWGRGDADSEDGRDGTGGGGGGGWGPGGSRGLEITMTHGGLDAIPEAAKTGISRDARALLRRRLGRDDDADVYFDDSGVRRTADGRAAGEEEGDGKGDGLEGFGSESQVIDGGGGPADDAGYGSATLSLAEALALASAGPSAAEHETAVVELVEASKRAEGKRDEDRREQRRRERKEDAMTRLKPMPAIPPLDFGKLPRRVRRPHSKLPKKPPPGHGAKPRPPGKPLPSVTGAGSAGTGAPPASPVAGPSGGAAAPSGDSVSSAGTPAAGSVTGGPSVASADGADSDSDGAWFFGGNAPRGRSDSTSDGAARAEADNDDDGDGPGPAREAPARPEQGLAQRESRGAALVVSTSAAGGAASAAAAAAAASAGGASPPSSADRAPGAPHDAGPPMRPPPKQLPRLESDRSDWSAGGQWADSTRAFHEGDTGRRDPASAGGGRVDITQAAPASSVGGTSDADAPGSAAGASRTRDIALGPVRGAGGAPRPSTGPAVGGVAPQHGGTRGGVVTSGAGPRGAGTPSDWRVTALRSATASAAARSGLGSPAHARLAARAELAQARHDGRNGVVLRPSEGFALSVDEGPGPADAGLRLAEAQRREARAIALVDPLRTSVVREAWDAVAPGTSVPSQAWLAPRVVRLVFAFLEEPREVYFEDDRMLALSQNMFATRHTGDAVRAAAAGGPGVDRGLQRGDGKANLVQAKARLDFMQKALHGGPKLRVAAHDD